MATRRISSVRVRRDSQGFTAGLSSAILEWLLIFLLFINALFSYFVTKFARFCELKIPCLLCSRLDHVLGNEKPGFYKDLICGAHKLEISSLVFCHIHDKLADVHEMCEVCLFSFATDKKSNSETYRLLVGKLGLDHECCVDKDPLLKYSVLGSSERHCSCCNELWKSMPYTHRLLPKKSISSDVIEIDVPLPGVLTNTREKSSGSIANSHVGNRGFDPLSHIGYTELKITSDSESEVPLSDDDDVNALLRETYGLKEESVARSDLPEPRIIVSYTLLNAPPEVMTLDKLSDQVSTPIPSLLVPHEQLDVGEPHNVTSLVSTIDVGHGLEELNWQQLQLTPCPPALPELISLHYNISPSNIVEAVVEVSRETFDVMGSGDILQTSMNEKTGSTIATGPCLEKDDGVEVSGKTSDVLGTVDIGQRSLTENGEVCKSEIVLATITEPGSKADWVSNDRGPPTSNLMVLSDAYKLAVGNKGGQPSSMLTEQLDVKDSAKVNEDLKLLLSQISATRGSEMSMNDMSPRVRGLGEELKISDASSSIELHTLQKRISIERNESGFESFDGSIVSEIEGESVVDRLKRQVEYDRKSMSALYKELDEERNASAIAANQAMAMITRLQEEKAALHMEALQYLRMMEEQAEYDVEALQKANDLLAEREKDIQDLEAELDFYRIKFPDETMVEKIEESHEFKVADMRGERSDLSCVDNSTNGLRSPQSVKKSEDSNKTDLVPGDNHMSIKGSLLDFEEERLYISQCLKKLEDKLNLCSDNGVHVDLCNGGYSQKEIHGVNDPEQDHCSEVIQGNTQMEDGSSLQKDSSLSRGVSQERSSPLIGDPRFVSQSHYHFKGPDTSITITESDLVSLENEVLDLNDRLEALEADRNFLEHTINSLRNGDEGLKFIQEIAHHLGELHRIGIRRREKDVA